MWEIRKRNSLNQEITISKESRIHYHIDDYKLQSDSTYTMQFYFHSHSFKLIGNIFIISILEKKNMKCNKYKRLTQADQAIKLDVIEFFWIQFLCSFDYSLRIFNWDRQEQNNLKP